jgi:hypothetical protein
MPTTAPADRCSSQLILIVDLPTGPYRHAPHRYDGGGIQKANRLPLSSACRIASWIDANSAARLDVLGIAGARAFVFRRSLQIVDDTAKAIDKGRQDAAVAGRRACLVEDIVQVAMPAADRLRQSPQIG